MKLVTVVATAVLLSACGSDSSSPTGSDSSQINNSAIESSAPAATDADLLNNDEGDAIEDGIDTDTASDAGNPDTPTEPTNDSTTGNPGTTTDNTDTNNNTDTATDSDTTATAIDQTDNDASDIPDASDNSDNSDNSDTIDTDTGPVTVGDCSAPTAGTTLVSSTTPVADIANPFYPEMGPQCVVPGSQFDGPGLQYGDFLLSNNAWNGQQSTWDWQQCIVLTTAGDGSILPSWTFDWGNEDDLQPGLFEWEVKSYPEIIYGAKSNTEVSAPCTTTGLPVLVQNLPEISIGYNYRTTLTNARIGDLGDEANNPIAVTGGDRNIAVESFFHSSCDIQRGRNSNIELELMVWLEVGNERLPSGSAPAHTFTSAAGHTYDVYTKPGNDQYLAYVAQNVVQADTLDWSEFINNTRANASTYGIRSIQDSWCLANILLGSEIWWGQGSVNFEYYQITSRY